MQFRSASVRPTRGAHVRYTPRLSGELSPGRKDPDKLQVFAAAVRSTAPVVAG